MTLTKWQRRIFGFFNNRGREVIKVLIATMCADDPMVLTRIRMQRVILRTEKNIANMPFFFFLMLKITIYLMEYAVPPLAWKFTPFTKMPLEARLKYLESWSGSRWYAKRMLMKLVLAICLPQVYSEKRLLISLGYEDSLQHRTSNQWSLTGRQ